jgi:hypothetical protein
MTKMIFFSTSTTNFTSVTQNLAINTPKERTWVQKSLSKVSLSMVPLNTQISNTKYTQNVVVSRFRLRVFFFHVFCFFVFISAVFFAGSCVCIRSANQGNYSSPSRFALTRLFLLQPPFFLLGPQYSVLVSTHPPSTRPGMPVIL